MRFLVLVLVAGCATTGPRPPRPEDMSAAEHRREAARERAQARDHLEAYEAEPIATIVPRSGGGGAPYLYPSLLYNPTAWHLDEADRHSEHARQHEVAARELERFEAAECAQFAPEARAVCPVLVGVESLRDLPNGVRLRFGAGAPVTAIAAHMRCHYAFARSRGFAAAVSCPMYVKGLRIDVAPGVIDLTGPDAAAAREIQKRAHEVVRIGKAPTKL